MATYNINLVEGMLKVGFGDPAQNDQIVKDAKARLDEMIADGTLAGGPVIKINGPASLPVAIAIGHAVAHRYGAVACFDPKLSKYVVCVSHSNDFAIGDLVE